MDERFVKGGGCPTASARRLNLYALWCAICACRCKAVDEVKGETEIYNVIMSTLKGPRTPARRARTTACSLSPSSARTSGLAAFHAFVRQYDLFDVLPARHNKQGGRGVHRSISNCRRASSLSMMPTPSTKGDHE